MSVTSNAPLPWNGLATTVRIQRMRGTTNKWMARPYPWRRGGHPRVTVYAGTVEEAARIVALRIEPLWPYPTLRVARGGIGGVIEQNGRRGVRLFESALGGSCEKD